MATKTVSEIREKIAEIEAAIEKEGFKPEVDGKKLQEHLYFVRIGAIDYLRWMLNEENNEDIPDF
jgi:hypothetical protein